MKIKEVGTEQFAGIRNKKISFGDGVNVVFGKNETGKSTLVNLISSVLFQNVKIDGKVKQDKDFKANAFPAESISKKSLGDNVDGVVVLEANGEEYTLNKTWRKEKADENEAAAKLTAPDKRIIRKQAEINDILGEILGYGAGVYKEMLLSPQSSAAENLKKVLENSGETSKTLADAVSQTLAESDGISIDKLERKINEAVFELAGAWWDTENRRPKSKGYTEKSKQLGEIMKSWIERENADKELKELEEHENDFDAALKGFSDREREAENAENALKEFDKYYDGIIALSSNNDTITRCNEDIKRFTEALESYPTAKAALESAQRLNEERQNRELLDRYLGAKKIHEDLEKIEKELKRLSRPEDGEIEALKAAEREIPRLEDKLRGINIDAKIRMLGGNSVKITSLISGEELPLDGESARISEAVRVEIPGVMEMELTPAEANAVEINSQIAKRKKEMSDILGKYGCKTIKEVERIASEYDKLKNERELAEKKLLAVTDDFAALESNAAALTNVRDKDEIDGEIGELCENEDINVFIGAKRNAVNNFEKEFGNEDKLRLRINDCRNELEKAVKAVETAESIPEKYQQISDPKEYKYRLDKAFKQAQKSKEEALAQKTAAQSSLNDFIENHGDDIRGKKEKADSEFKEKVERLDKWLHIKEAFDKHKAALTDNPLETLASNFVKYLERISGDRVTAEFTEAGKPDFKVSSGDYALDYGKLSDGTKETIFLAFRLAVLEHLFPDGGGVIVLDDPLNDMDIDRVKRSCELIGDIAERHQIIFLTCREEYAETLGGNQIRI